MDNALFKSFDSLLRGQLDPHWHKIGPKTRQLVSDMTTLRQLLTYLLALDCVGFNQYLETVISSNGGGTLGSVKAHPSPWLYLPAAERIIQASRKRVYLKESEVPKVSPPTEAPDASNGANDEEYWKDFEPNAEEEEEALRLMEAYDAGADLPQPANGASSSARMAPPPAAPAKKWYEDLHIKPILEEQPKWELLSQVLDEIEQDLHINPELPSELSFVTRSSRMLTSLLLQTTTRAIPF